MKREAGMKGPLSALKTIKENLLRLGIGLTLEIRREKKTYIQHRVLDLEPIKSFGVSQATIY